MTHPSFPATHFYYTLVPIHTIHGEALTPDPPARPQGMRWHHTGKAYACGSFMVFQWTGQRLSEIQAYEEFKAKERAEKQAQLDRITEQFFEDVNLSR